MRLGFSVGGTGFAGVVVEWMRDGRGIELTAGTVAFRDLSVSAAVRAYLGPSALRPLAGAGLWAVIAPRRGENQGGIALLARLPIGFDWRVAPGHFVDLDVNVYRALLVWRTEAAGAVPRGRLVPIPGVSYRWMP